jgi:hypothetical protein
MGYQKFLATELPPEMLKDRNGKELFPPGTAWLELTIQATVRQAATGDIRAIKEIREAIEGRSGMRSEAFRELPDEEPLDETQRALMELDQVDRNLIAAATSKVIDVIRDEALGAAEALDRG